MQLGSREREARYLQFTIQCSGDLIYIPRLLAHRFNFGHVFTNNFFRMGRRYYIKAT